MLLLLGVPDRAVMGIMGWSNSTRAARYQYRTAEIRRDIANRVGGLIWDRPAGGDNPDEGVSRVPSHR